MGREQIQRCTCDGCGKVQETKSPIHLPVRPAPNPDELAADFFRRYGELRAAWLREQEKCLTPWLIVTYDDASNYVHMYHRIMLLYCSTECLREYVARDIDRARAEREQDFDAPDDTGSIIAH
jgi:hypothetical protein